MKEFTILTISALGILFHRCYASSGRHPGKKCKQKRIDGFSSLRSHRQGKGAVSIVVALLLLQAFLAS